MDWPAMSHSTVMGPTVECKITSAAQYVRVYTIST